MLELLIAAVAVAQFGGFAAPECEVAFEVAAALPDGAPVPTGSRLPYDAILYVTLQRQ